MTSIDPDRLMVDQSAISCGDVHSSRAAGNRFPLGAPAFDEVT
jgi:hypothetical protein